MVVCKIMRRDSDGTLKHGEWLEGGERVVYKESVVGVGGFPFLLSLLILLNSKASYDFDTASTPVMVLVSQNEYLVPCFVCDITLLLPISPTPDPTHYTYEVLRNSNYVAIPAYYLDDVVNTPDS